MDVESSAERSFRSSEGLGDRPAVSWAGNGSVGACGFVMGMV